MAETATENGTTGVSEKEAKVKCSPVKESKETVQSSDKVEDSPVKESTKTENGHCSPVKESAEGEENRISKPVEESKENAKSSPEKLKTENAKCSPVKESTSVSPKSSPTKKDIDIATQALNHLAQGKRHLLVNDISSAVNSLQEACRLLAEHYGETAPECADAYFYYGKALLELARIENGVLGNALDGVPLDVSDENCSKIEDPEKLTEEEKDLVREEVGDAFEENFTAAEKLKASKQSSTITEEKSNVESADSKTDSKEKEEQMEVDEAEENEKTKRIEDSSEKDLSKISDKMETAEKDSSQTKCDVLETVKDVENKDLTKKEETCKTEVEKQRDTETAMESEEAVTETAMESEEAVKETEKPVETAMESEVVTKEAEKPVETTMESEEAAKETEKPVETAMESEEAVKKTEKPAEASLKSEEAVKKTEKPAEASLKSEEAVKKTEKLAEASLKSEEAVKKTEKPAEASLKSEEAVKKTEKPAEASLKSEEAVKKTEKPAEASLKSEEAVKKTEKPAEASLKSEEAQKIEVSTETAMESDEVKEKQETKKSGSEKDKEIEETETVMELDEKEDVEKTIESDKIKENKQDTHVQKEGGSTEEENDDDSQEGESQEDQEGQEETSQDDDDAKAEDEDEMEGEKTEEDEEEVGNLQLAWEMLELAKHIYEKQEISNPSVSLKIAQVYLKLGEIGLENENYQGSVEDFLQCLKIQKNELKPDDRCIAESNYQLGVAYSFADDFDNAIAAFGAACDVVELRILNLKQRMKEKAAWTEEEKKKYAEECQDPFYTEQGEIDELSKLLPEIKEKIVDMEEMKKDSKDKLQKFKESSIFANILRGGSKSDDGASTSAEVSTVFSSPKSCPPSDKPASNITHLVRKKRKPEDEAEKEEPKKQKVENGDALETTTNGPEKVDASPSEDEKMDVEPVPS